LLRLQAEDAPRLALLDWMMPGLDGTEVCRRLRAQASAPYTYVLLITARDRQSDVIAGLEAGADDYITKPFHPQELKARLHVGIRVLELEQELVAAREAMRFKASHDALTGLLNRGQILETLEKELERARRDHKPLGLLLADVDHFKSVNDQHGHPAGDDVLREVGARLAASVRPYDAVGRYGGEEFLVLMSACETSAAAEKGEQLRAAMDAVPVRTSAGTFPITISVGCVSTEELPEASPQRLLSAVDEALYRAKQAGRNRAEVWHADSRLEIHTA
jgi:two-component system cell cycle response regulator